MCLGDMVQEQFRATRFKELHLCTKQLTAFYKPSILKSPSAGLLGSEEQKQQMLPKLANFTYVGAWALTEPSNGSDASALQSTARKVTPLCSRDGLGFRV